MTVRGECMSNEDFQSGYPQPPTQSFEPQSAHAALPAQYEQPPKPRSGALIALSIASGVLLLTTIAFAGTTAWLFTTRGTPATTEQKTDKKADGQGDQAEETKLMAGGIALEVISDLTFNSFGVSNREGDTLNPIYATVKNEDKTRAAEAYFDITLYDKKNRVIARTPSNVYLLPGQTSMFYGAVGGEIASGERIVVEQTSIELVDPVLSGGIKIDELSMDEEIGYVLGKFTASLSAAPEYPDVFMAAFDGDRLVGACQASPDIPAEGTFEADCILEPLGQENASGKLKLSKDVEFEVYLALDIPW